MIYINDFSRKFELDLKSVCENSPYGARIISYHTAYHGQKYNFLDFWLCRTDSGRVICAFCKYYSTLIICGNIENYNEAENFIKMISVTNILCDGNIDLHLNMRCTHGETLRCKKIQSECEFDFPVTKVGSDITKLRSVYNLLICENAKSKSVPNFESYFLDISHRIRHRTSEVYAIFNEDGRAVSTASVTAQSEDCAVIGCVATDFYSRRQGMATSLVHNITKKQLDCGRSVYLHRERKIHLYRKIGFNVVGIWREYSVSE